jgi:hypothetical protein
METLEQRLQRLVPGRAAAPGAVPGASATKTVLNKPEPRKAGSNSVMDFIQDNIFYTPEKKQEINNALVESQSKNPAMLRPDPINLRDVAGTATGVLGALGGAALGMEPTLEGGLTAIEGGFREGKKAGQKLFDDTLGAAGIQAKPQFADLRGSATPGSVIPATDNSAADKAFAAAAGTDTGSGDRESLREVPRSAPPKELSAGMAAWAAANPELAKKMVDKVDARRMKNPEYTQSGYDPVREVVYPGNAALAAEQNQGDFSIRDAVGGKMSPEDAGTIASGGFVETVFDKGVQSPSTSSNDQEKKSIDLLNNYISKNKPAVIESTIPSQAQGVAPVGGDGTILDSELEVGKAIPDFTGKMDGSNKNMSNRFRAF